MGWRKGRKERKEGRKERAPQAPKQQTSRTAEGGSAKKRAAGAFFFQNDTPLARDSAIGIALKRMS